MKKHAIIPIFIPHLGCPYDCIFCDQKKITAKSAPVSIETARQTMDTWLTTLGEAETVEVAFYGGSFTCIPEAEQRRYLALAKEYKDAGRLQKIHLSTRPDAIDDGILDMLCSYGVDVIELGVQSLDDEVLRLSGRGHDAACVYRSAELIKHRGITLGIQLMIGLPGDSMETCCRSARETVKMGADIARLYPVVILKDTALYDMVQDGAFVPLSEDEQVARTKAMYEILDDAGVNIIRVGLKSSDVLGADGNAVEGTFHPAFRQLVEGEIAKDRMIQLLGGAGITAPADNTSDAGIVAQIDNSSGAGMAAPADISGSSGAGRGKSQTITFRTAPSNFSNMVGNKGRNRDFFAKHYPALNIRYEVDRKLRGKEITIDDG